MNVLAVAVERLMTDGVEAGRVALAPIAGQRWTRRLTLARPITRAERRPPPTARRSFNAARSAVTLARDGFTCRYCGNRVVPRRLLVALSSIYEAELPYYEHYAYGSVHPAFWVVAAEADHLDPGSRGGHWTDPENFVSACVRCNTIKGAWQIEELGWELRPPRSGGSWLGLTQHYREIWRIAGYPSPRYHEPFIRALEDVPPPERSPSRL